MIEENLEQKLEKKRKELKELSLKYPRINTIPLTGTHYNRDKYIDICNDSGLVLASCTDYYNAAKYYGGSGINFINNKLKQNLEMFKSLNDKKDNSIFSKNMIIKEISNLIDSTNICYEKGDGVIITGDSIRYYKNSLNADLIKNYKSQVKDKIKEEIVVLGLSYPSTLLRNYESEFTIQREEKIILPEFNSYNIEEVVDNILGLSFLQKIFNTKDDPETICLNVKKIFNDQFSQIYFESPIISQRDFSQFNNVRSIAFKLGNLKNDDFQELHIDCNFKDHKNARAYCLKKADSAR